MTNKNQIIVVTDEVTRNISDGLKNCDIGVAHFFIQHTSAALSINENYDPDVRKDMDMALDHLVPENLKWRHTDEGPDDSVSHTKASLIGSSISIPITKGKLNLGNWQGIYLTEFRHMPHTRRIVCTITP
ncbi:hypothetical protein CROQUDRAFT_642941 [Cronartium quercuum f. sp. fusiforme G11]|uniref:Secondary thiamine-phosphate synthase enzyme n=1 Tax=Cronartium quercuum f. sp. fusiforme G11 TaxID=708437 RepID=A0A9P6NCE5_9BASI|nr:hypothetical protein CROQUDRAFT_642941 [Cronartium quercuum f. sp. fusiforme G11]